MREKRESYILFLDNIADTGIVPFVNFVLNAASLHSPPGHHFTDGDGLIRHW
jgi:hypothetical protein